MGRHQENPAHRYFYYDKVSNKSFCKIEGCGAEISGHHGGNLQRHLQRRHPAEHAETTAQKRPASADGLMTLDLAVVKRPKISGLHVQLSPDIIKDACIELVTINGRPLSLMEDSGFRKMIDPIQEAIGNGFAINSTNICEMVSDVAQGEREQLKNELNGRLLMLKIDSATCRGRIVLCINVQYTDEEKIVMHTLAIKELTERHTTEYISSVVKDVLREYNVELRQVYSVTSDNGVNMMKEVYLMSDMPDGLSNDRNETGAPNTQVKEELTEAEVGNQELDIELDSVMQGHMLDSIRCPAHTFQIAVEDALKEKRSSSLICEARRIAKELSTQNIVIPLKKMGHERATVDSAMCWQSAYHMLEQLLELRSLCEDMSPAIKELHLNENEWQDIANLVCALKPAKIAMKSLQSDHLTAGDFYGVWLQCVLCTDKIDNLFAKRLVQCLRVRQATLFDSDAFVAALFLDPRYRLFLTEHQTERAKIHLTHAWDAIEYLSGNNATDSAQCTPFQSSEEDDEIERLLMAKELEATTVRSFDVSITSLLDVYSRGARLKRSECLFKYWASVATTNPDLYKLAMNVIALPVTQVSVERAYSCLRFILSEPALSMNAQVLEDVLFLRLNKQYGFAVNYK